MTGPLLRDPDGGADTTVWLAATEPAPGGGRFWHDRAPPAPEHYRAPHPARPTRTWRGSWTYVLDAPERRLTVRRLTEAQRASRISLTAPSSAGDRSSALQREHGRARGRAAARTTS